MGNDNGLTDALPWENLLQGTYTGYRRYRIKPPFLVGFGAHAAFVGNGTSIVNGNFSSNAFVANSGRGEDDSLIKSDCESETFDAEVTFLSDLSILRDKLKTTLTEQLRLVPTVKEFWERTMEEGISSELNFLSRIVASTKNSKVVNALAEPVRSVQEFIQRSVGINTTTGNSLDLLGIVSASRLLQVDCPFVVPVPMTTVGKTGTLQVRRGGGDAATFLSCAHIGLDNLARSIAVTAGKIVTFQCLVTWLKYRELNWIEQVCRLVLIRRPRQMKIVCDCCQHCPLLHCELLPCCHCSIC
jgi:hypothetical protein